MEESDHVADDEELQAGLFHEDAPAVQLTEEDLKDARERAELSLLARIFWEEPRELLVVENSFLRVWRCGRVRVFYVGSGLYQFIFPTVSKRNWVLESQSWFFQRSIIHFTDVMTPSEDLFHSLQFMPIWVKIIGIPFASLTIAVGRKLLAKLGEVLKIGYFDAGTPEGSYIKGRVRMNLLDSFLGTTPVFRPNGTSFPAYFQYIGIPCICFLCGFLGHVMADCSRTDVVFDKNIRALWMCGKVAPNEKEGKGPQLQTLPPIQPPNSEGRGGLPPSVAAGLSSTLNRQWARERQAGGTRGRGGPACGGPRPFLALPGPTPFGGPASSLQPGGSGSSGPRTQNVRPLRILPPNASASGGHMRTGPIQAGQVATQAQTTSAASFIRDGGATGRGLGRSRSLAPSLQLNTKSGQPQLGLLPRAATSSSVGPIRASSAPVLFNKPGPAVPGRRSAPHASAQVTP
ncbi:hypothetical protein LINPERHAP1_LOCUS32675 [Linum perenne]